LENALSTTKTLNQHHVLCYLDLDQFKIVNDTCGHAAGDELLRQVTALLQSQVRSTDVLARLGGDEFGLLLKQCSVQKGLVIANNMCQSLRELRFVYEGKTFMIGVSIGLVGIDANTLITTAGILGMADAACYVAKNGGRNRVQVYCADEHQLFSQHKQKQWIERISEALEHNHFRLYFQPMLSLSRTNHYREHYEILLRLQDESGQLVQPMAFIPVAERYNLMPQIDRWVIRTFFACLGEHSRNRQQCSPLQNTHCLYAINLSGASINDPQFINFLHEQFKQHQIPPELICFEVTETVAINNLSQAAKLILDLKQLGCHFALDDFGSGMSSFAYLKNLPVDFLKIDGGFVKEIANDPTSLALTDAIHRIGHVMGMQTIAEYVENSSILEMVREIGVDYAQGFGVAEPSPLSDILSTQ
ncbi:MAG: EAL domain-containing protein, partial [Thermosynechococcaceae cyanobacterium]